MAYRFSRSTVAALAAALLLSACTTKEQETPPLSGPSELSTAINISVSPDVLRQDGASQSLVTITARDANGQLLRNFPIRVEIAVNGVISDFGTLSARNLVTDANGMATLVYTAPAAPATNVDNSTTVQILVMPSGTNFDNGTFRFASIRLVPPGVVVAPNDLIALFTFSPLSPTTDSTVIFDATASASANPNSTIVSYDWDFGDGTSANGRQVTHRFDDGSYTVTLTIRDTTNRTGTARQNVTVSIPPTTLTAAFVVSPTPPRVGEATHFDASLSTITPPRRIVSYTWNFGDGTVITTVNPRIDHVFTQSRAFTVLLTVTDDTNQTKTAQQTITPIP
jgi:PKD repeat protein